MLSDAAFNGWEGLSEDAQEARAREQLQQAFRLFDRRPAPLDAWETVNLMMALDLYAQRMFPLVAIYASRALLPPAHRKTDKAVGVPPRWEGKIVATRADLGFPAGS